MARLAPRHPLLLGLAESLSPHLQSSTLERRLKLAQALDQWLLDGSWGTERQFSQRALGRSKAFGAADRQWLAEFGIDLKLAASPATPRTCSCPDRWGCGPDSTACCPRPCCSKAWPWGRRLCWA